MLHDTATLITRRNTMLTLGGMTALVLALSVGSAEAGTTELRNTISANAALQHLYSFEGATDAERRADGEGSVDLSNVVGSTGGNVATSPTCPASTAMPPCTVPSTPATPPKARACSRRPM